jgi:hypothetical protein
VEFTPAYHTRQAKRLRVHSFRRSGVIGAPRLSRSGMPGTASSRRTIR